MNLINPYQLLGVNPSMPDLKQLKNHIINWLYYAILIKVGIKNLWILFIKVTYT